MEINKAFGLYLILAKQIEEIKAATKILINELNMHVNKASPYATAQKSEAPRIVQLYEMIKRNEVAITQKTELLGPAKKEIIKFLKTIRPLIAFPFKDAGDLKIYHFELDGEEIRFS